MIFGNSIYMVKMVLLVQMGMEWGAGTIMSASKTLGGSSTTEGSERTKTGCSLCTLSGSVIFSPFLLQTS